MTTEGHRRAETAASPGVRVGVGALVGWTVLSMAACGAALAGWTAAWGGESGWRSLAGATVIAGVAAAVGMFPVVLVAIRGSASQIAFAFLAGMMLRMMSVVGLLAVTTGETGLPRRMTAIFTVAYYACVLAAEVGVLVSGLRRAFPNPAAGSVPTALPR